MRWARRQAKTSSTSGTGARSSGGVIWAFGHKLWKQALIGLAISVVTLGIAGIGVSIWYALKGNRWAWEAGNYSSKEELRQKERKWAWAYLWLTVAFIALGILLAILGG